HPPTACNSPTKSLGTGSGIANILRRCLHDAPSPSRCHPIIPKFPEEPFFGWSSARDLEPRELFNN
ncbi:MAG TPA: hypothetical protein VE869_05925, partial [Gemmatimonas sp.]|nr:hypothetical protein [Gemmatimonas sp.]